MKSFLVTWTIDIEADTPEDAARDALRIQRNNDPDNSAVVFDVKDSATGKIHKIDLDE